MFIGKAKERSFGEKSLNLAVSWLTLETKSMILTEICKTVMNSTKCVTLHLIRWDV